MFFAIFFGGGSPRSLVETGPMGELVFIRRSPMGFGPRRLGHWNVWSDKRRELKQSVSERG